MKNQKVPISEKKILGIVQKIRVGYRMKRTLRYSTKRDFNVHNESVAEHVFALIFLAQYFLKKEKAGKTINKAKLYEILLFHDFGEILHGDIPYHQKTKEHEKNERKDAKKVFSMLPAEIRKTALMSWQAYERRNSIEARFAVALDKIEPLFELYDPVNELSMKRLKFTYVMNITVKRRATEEFSVMRTFAEAISNDMVRRNVFWEER